MAFRVYICNPDNVDLDTLDMQYDDFDGFGFISENKFQACLYFLENKSSRLYEFEYMVKLEEVSMDEALDYVERNKRYEMPLADKTYYIIDDVENFDGCLYQDGIVCSDEDEMNRLSEDYPELEWHEASAEEIHRYGVYNS